MEILDANQHDDYLLVWREVTTLDDVDLQEDDVRELDVQNGEQEIYYDGWHAEKQDAEDLILDVHVVMVEDVVVDELVVLEEDVAWDQQGVSQEDVVLNDDVKDQML